MSEDNKLVIENLYKIFGPSPDEAMKLVEQGYHKDDILEQTGNTIGVQDASFSIRAGEIFVVMGLSGSGKSTLVRMLNRLIEPTSGAVKVDGQDVTQMSKKELIDLRRHNMSMVFQSFALMPHKSVLDNAAFGLEASRVPKDKRRERAARALESVGLGAWIHSFPHELSGGMKQRVGLARALATDPSIMLMDEAFSALDPLIRTEMQDELLELQHKDQRTVVFISHDLDEAMRIGDRIAMMEGGRVVQVGTPEEIVTNPANDYVRSFFYGVDVSQVFSAGDIATNKQVTVIQRPGVDVGAALSRLREHDREYGVVVDRDRQYQGVVSASGLAEAYDSGSEDRWSMAFEKDVEPVTNDRPLTEVLGIVADSRWPVPVVDGEGRYLGSISKTALLQTLKKAG
ncbi:glycine betaine/L-proline ABC transporter ATP-binding protein ProV [Aquisalimonas lutea]|uniref:glycine betaine/L-proline ABC transporter ATP-binding protein ProV n=1 Tax=Aquisalimonas lutea TaxID=1327750 RepID=UPI0025B5FA4B|nr:glycine betaine/L-proline ABC transporter ATP-binding protein ProV [Aquisalimonas lutea]MDN3518632.1 glycine betaine/L-proline ABC transporter ATP-binding protein ProV [Aquisalimonas lutea]